MLSEDSKIKLLVNVLEFLYSDIMNNCNSDGDAVLQFPEKHLTTIRGGIFCVKSDLQWVQA